MSQTAKYVAISEEIIAEIRAGTLRPGDRLPTERELALRFNVHRMTVRQATDILTRRGIVEKRLPLGVFVRQIERARVGLGVLNLIGPNSPIPLVSLFYEYGTRRAVARKLQPRILRISPGDEHLAAAAILSGEPSLVFGIANPQGEICAAMRRANGRSAGIAMRLEHLGIPSVVGDDHTGLHSAVQHLVSLGHRRIGLVCSSPGHNLPIVEIQIQNWRQAMFHHIPDISMEADEAAAGIIRIEPVALGGTLVGAYEAVKAYLKKNPRRLTALIGLEEIVTDGAAAACNILGLRVPEDISLVAYAGTYQSAMTLPARTSMAISVKDHVDAALAMIDASEHNELSPQQLLRFIRPKLIIRKSTASPK